MTTDRSLSCRVAALAASALLAALAAPIASAQATRSNDARTTSIDELKVAYLACDRASMSRILDGSEAMQCSVVYEELKRREFGGNFERLFAWSRAQHSARVSGR